MKKFLIIVLSLLILLLGSQYLIFTRKIAKPNPVECTYNFSISNVRDKINNIFSNSNYHRMYYAVGYNTAEKNLLKITDAENHNHIFLNWSGLSPFGKSEIYYNWWGKLELYLSSHIILDSLSERQTRIRIESFPQVETGYIFDLNHGVPYLTSLKVGVMPSTIEEYGIIKKIGDALGEKSMPLIIN